MTRLAANMRRDARRGRGHHGFSIVEVMVGMVIAMLGIVVMMQVFALSEGQKRTTTSGADAQGNGLAALNTMERDLRMAGYGLASSTLLGASGCSQIQWFYNNASQPALTMAPVRIVDGGGGLPDSITVMFGNAMNGTVPATIANTMPQPSAVIDVDRTTGFNAGPPGDLFVVAQGGVCVMMQVTQVMASPNKLQHNPGAKGPYNPSASQIPASWPAFTQGAQIFDVGQLTNRSYSVNSSNLQTVEVPATTAAAVLVSNIVNIQAQYGVAPAAGSPGYPTVNCWVNATGAGSNACDGADWANPTSANIARIKAVRIAVVARSTLPEKPSVTGGTCDATIAAPASWTGGPAIDLSADPNWQCYRYKVFQTIVPLRNVIWANT